MAYICPVTATERGVKTTTMEITANINTSNDTINQFIIEMTLIDPINKIVSELKDNGFRNCDIKWLNDKLDGFMTLAAKTFGINTVFLQSGQPTIMNAWAKEYYLRHFNQLLDYYKTFNN